MKPDYKNPTYQPPVRGIWMPLFMLMMIACEALPLTQRTGHNKEDKPTKEWCEDAGFKNHSRYVPGWIDAIRRIKWVLRNLVGKW